MPLKPENNESNNDVKQEDDNNGSDDDQMVICEDTPAEIDLKCKDKLTDSDNEMQDDEKGKKRIRYSSPVNEKRDSQNSKQDVTCRPKPIKGYHLFVFHFFK